MADIVNLKLAKKRKAREEREAEAATNRAKFGRTKDEKQRGKAETEAARRKLDGHRLDGE